MKFKYWFNENQITTLKDLFNIVKNFTPTINKPFPSAVRGEKELIDQMNMVGDIHPEILDVLAVLANRKPAAHFSNKFTPELFKKIEDYAKSQGLEIQKLNNNISNSDYYLIGHPKNVEALQKLFPAIRTTKGPELLKIHRLIGQNLGFPPDVIEDFITRISKQL